VIDLAHGGVDAVLAVVAECDCITLLLCLASRFDRYGWSGSGAGMVLMLR
jgi:hypothetical protein